MHFSIIFYYFATLNVCKMMSYVVNIQPNNYICIHGIQKIQLIDMIMKKLLRLGMALLLPVAAVLVVVYKAVNQAPSPELPQYEQVLEIFDEGGCLSCHSADPKLPFYAKLPVAGKVILKDIDSGYRAYDMTKFMEELKVDGEVSPVDLAKIAKVVLDDRMPTAK